MRLPRFRIRRLMIAVSLCALAIETYRLKRLSDDYRAKASSAGTREGAYRQIYALEITTVESAAARIKDEEPLPPGGPPELPKEIEAARLLLHNDYSEQEADAELDGKLASYYQQLRLKFERASRYPWLPVAPDPPMPK
jgi:hypothetical protein